MLSEMNIVESTVGNCALMNVLRRMDSQSLGFLARNGPPKNEKCMGGRCVCVCVSLLEASTQLRL